MFRPIEWPALIRQTVARAVEVYQSANSKLEEHRSVVASNIHAVTGRLGLIHGGAASLQNLDIARAMMPKAALCRSVSLHRRSIVPEKKSPQIDCQKRSDARSESADVRRRQPVSVEREAGVLPKDQLAVAIHCESVVRSRMPVQCQQS